MNATLEKKSSRTIRAEAADWFTLLQAPVCSAETKAAFEVWRKADALHELAYEQCRTLWLMTYSLKDDADINRELHKARKGSNISAPTKARPGNRTFWQGAALAATLMIFSIGILFNLPSPSQEYTTGIGEQHLIQLPDGSTAMLNTDSKISVSFTDGKRRIELTQGEAYFTVSKDPQRPFEVVAATGLVRAVGTEFNVALLNRMLSVDVTEGIVEFETSTTRHPKPHVIANIKHGEAVKYRAGDDTVTIEAANTARITAWQSRKIYFAATTLADAVAEYNRYTKEKITIVDNELKTQRITGIFNLGDMDTFIFSLEQALDARVERRQHRVLVMKK